MMPEADDPDDAVERLETALELIARFAGQPAPAHHQAAGLHEAAEDPSGDRRSRETAGSEDLGSDGPLVPAEEIATRLDDLIDRLRVALSNKAG